MNITRTLEILDIIDRNKEKFTDMEYKTVVEYLADVQKNSKHSYNTSDTVLIIKYTENFQDDGSEDSEFPYEENYEIFKICEDNQVFYSTNLLETIIKLLSVKFQNRDDYKYLFDILNDAHKAHFDYAIIDRI